MKEPTTAGGDGSCTCVLSVAAGDPNVRIVNDPAGNATVINVIAAQNTAVQIIYQLSATNWGTGPTAHTNLSIASAGIYPSQISVLPGSAVGILDTNSLPAGQAFAYWLNIKGKFTPGNGGMNTYVWDPGIDNEN